MKPVKPAVAIVGDLNQMMYKNGYVVGWKGKDVVWCFGFVPGSPYAKAFGISIAQPLYVLAKCNGKRLAVVATNNPATLPKEFQSVLKG